MLKRNLTYRLAIFLVKYQDYQVHTSTYLIKFIFWWIKIDKLTIRDRHLVILEEIWMRLQKHLWLFYWWEQFVPLEFCHTNIIKLGTYNIFQIFLLLKIPKFKIEPLIISGQNCGNMKLLKFKIMTIPCLLDSIHLQKDMDQFKSLELELMKNETISN